MMMLDMRCTWPPDCRDCWPRAMRRPKPQQTAGFFDILLSGGIVGLMILLVLFALSIAAAYLVFDQIMTLRRSEILPEGVSDTVRQVVVDRRVPPKPMQPVDGHQAC